MMTTTQELMDYLIELERQDATLTTLEHLAAVPKQDLSSHIDEMIAGIKLIKAELGKVADDGRTN